MIERVTAEFKLTREESFTPAAITGMDVVRAARLLKGTRFEHAGEGPDGIDCSGVALWVAKRLRQAPADLRRPAYSKFRPSPRLFMLMLRWCDLVEEGREPWPGDMHLMASRETVETREVQHVAVRTDRGLLHIFPAESIARVVEHEWDPEWERRVIFTLRFKGVAARGD